MSTVGIVNGASGAKGSFEVSVLFAAPSSARSIMISKQPYTLSAHGLAFLIAGTGPIIAHQRPVYDHGFDGFRGRWASESKEVDAVR